MFRIGEFSKLAKTTVKTLRYYYKVGLLKPAFVDSETSYRYYSEAQLEIMREILAYKAVGIQNSDISDILKNGNADARYFTVENVFFDYDLSKPNMDGVHIQGPARLA